MKNKLMCGLVVVGLAAMSSTTSAAITGPTVIDFQTLGPASVAGKPNLAGTAGNTSTILEDGIRWGIVADPLDGISHLHKQGVAPGNVQLQYHADSSGIYMRAADDTAFSLWSMTFHAAYNAIDNPHTVGGGGDGLAANDFWHIYGFSDARNPGLLTANTNPTTGMPTDPNSGFSTNPAVAHATVANGFDGILDLLALDANFKNISSFWIHYNGYPHSPNAYIDPNDPNSSAYQFGVSIDDVNLNAPAVPVPAAVWMFGSGLLGLLSLGRKKLSLTV